MEVGKVLDATVVNMRFVKLLDTDTLLKVALDHDTLVTLEESVIQGGAGSACAEYLAAFGLGIRCSFWVYPIPSWSTASATKSSHRWDWTLMA